VKAAGGDVDHADIQNVTAAQHHAKYTDADAVSAMGGKADGNPLNHDIYVDADAVSAMGGKADGNPLNHDIYTDGEAVDAAKSIVEDTPIDDNADVPISSNWAFDHTADATAHHTKYTDGDATGAMGAKGNGNPLNHDRYSEATLVQMILGYSVGGAGARAYKFFPDGDQVAQADLTRNVTTNGTLVIGSKGTGGVLFYLNSATSMTVLPGGEITGCWDDTPTNGQNQKGVSSDWAFDHKADASAHHAKYLDAAAVAAVKLIVDNVPVDGETDIPISSHWAFDHEADTTIHHTAPVVFVDRGDPAAVDWDEGDLTEDNTWRDLDVTAITGAGAIAVLLRVNIQYNSASPYISFRENGNSNNINWSVLANVVANQNHYADMVVRLGAGEVFEYKATASPTSINITVAGWWI